MHWIGEGRGKHVLNQRMHSHQSSGSHKSMCVNSLASTHGRLRNVSFNTWTLLTQSFVSSGLLKFQCVPLLVPVRLGVLRLERLSFPRLKRSKRNIPIENELSEQYPPCWWSKRYLTCCCASSSLSVKIWAQEKRHFSITLSKASYGNRITCCGNEHGYLIHNNPKAYKGLILANYLYYLINYLTGQKESLVGCSLLQTPRNSEDANSIHRIWSSTDVLGSVFSTVVRGQELHTLSPRLLGLGGPEFRRREKGLPPHLINLSGNFITNIGSDTLLLLHVAKSHFTPAGKNSTPVNNIFQGKIRNRLQSNCK